MKDGGPAFPAQHSIDGNWVKVPLSEYCGMSLRDYFAAAALQSCIIGQYENAKRQHLIEDSTIAKDAYQYADAMLIEREKS